MGRVWEGGRVVQKSTAYMWLDCCCFNAAQIVLTPTAPRNRGPFLPFFGQGGEGWGRVGKGGRRVGKGGGSNYDSLIVRTVAFPVQVAYWTKRSCPLRKQCPMSILTSGPETWPWGPVG